MFIPVLMVQELYKSTKKCESYSRKYSGSFLWNTAYARSVQGSLLLVLSAHEIVTIIRTRGRCTSSWSRTQLLDGRERGRPEWWWERSPVVQWTEVIYQSVHWRRVLSRTLTPQWLLLVSAISMKYCTNKTLCDPPCTTLSITPCLSICLSVWQSVHRLQLT